MYTYLHLVFSDQLCIVYMIMIMILIIGNHLNVLVIAYPHCEHSGDPF